MALGVRSSSLAELKVEGIFFALVAAAVGGLPSRPGSSKCPMGMLWWEPPGVIDAVHCFLVCMSSGQSLVGSLLEIIYSLYSEYYTT